MSITHILIEEKAEDIRQSLVVVENDTLFLIKSLRQYKDRLDRHLEQILSFASKGNQEAALMNSELGRVYEDLNLLGSGMRVIKWDAERLENLPKPLAKLPKSEYN
jgi:hypothetical protein